MTWHVARLGAYWAEVMGGPALFSSRPDADQSAMLRMHAGNGDLGDLGERFLVCFVGALDDAGLPTDPQLRAALTAYLRWAVDGMLAVARDDPSSVPADLGMPHWSWEGLVGQPS